MDTTPHPSGPLAGKHAPREEGVEGAGQLVKEALRGAQCLKNVCISK